MSAPDILEVMFKPYYRGLLKHCPNMTAAELAEESMKEFGIQRSQWDDAEYPPRSLVQAAQEVLDERKPSGTYLH